jgi:hypothetical protein
MSTVMEQARSALGEVVTFYRAHGCPCAYPRFAQLAGFNFRDHGVGPVGSHLQQLLIGMTCYADDAFYRAAKVNEGPQQMHRCAVCGTQVLVIDEEFSINMRFDRLEFSGAIRAAQRGLPAEKIPVPEGGGFFGFDAADIARCREAMTIDGTFAEMTKYLTALDLRWPPRFPPAVKR